MPCSLTSLVGQRSYPGMPFTPQKTLRTRSRCSSAQGPGEADLHHPPQHPADPLRRCMFGTPGFVRGASCPGEEQETSICFLARSWTSTSYK